MLRRLVHVPLGWKPTILEVVVPRYRCWPCRRIWRHSITAAAPSKGKLSRDAIMLAVKSIVVDRMSIARVAANLGVAWNTASDAILAAGAELVDSADRFDGVTTVGVDEHVWRHTRNGDNYVTVIIDLTPTRTRTGPSRLLAVVEGRSKQAIDVLARSPDHGVPGPGRDRRDGRVHRLQDRRGRNDRHPHHRDGSLSMWWP